MSEPIESTVRFDCLTTENRLGGCAQLEVKVRVSIESIKDWSTGEDFSLDQLFDEDRKDLLDLIKLNLED